jgi:hypothetical protein
MGRLVARLKWLLLGGPERRRNLEERARRAAAVRQERSRRSAVRREDLRLPLVAV